MPQTQRLPDFQVAGDSDTTVFLLHGAYGSKDYFRNEIESLVRAGLRVVAWDAPGYGLSPVPAGGLRIEGMAAAAVRLVKLMGGRTNVLLGHSMGGIIAPAAAVMAPDLVHGLVISATVASFSQKSEADKKNFLEERIAPLQQGKTFREVAAAVIDSMFAPGSSGPLVELVREVALGTAKDTFIASIEAIVEYEGVQTLRSVKVPTLLLAGQHDKVGRPDGMQNIKTSFIPQAEFHILPHSGHYGFAEEPALFNQHLLAFIQHHFA